MTRKTLDLGAALAADKPAEKPAPVAPRTRTTVSPTKGRTAPRGTPTVARATTVLLNLYVNEVTYQQARAAYVADFANRGEDAPNGLDHWIADAVGAHARLKPAARKKVVKALPPEAEVVHDEHGQPDKPAKKSVKVRISEDVSTALDAAVAEDELMGVYGGRSPFAIAAIRAAVEAARDLNGGVLPPPPGGRLPVRRRTSR